MCIVFNVVGDGAAQLCLKDAFQTILEFASHSRFLMRMSAPYQG